MSALAALNKAFTASCNVVTAVAEGTEKFAQAYSEIGSVAYETAHVYHIEARGRSIKKASELGVDLNFGDSLPVPSLLQQQA